MKYFKVKMFYKGKEEEYVLKAFNRPEAIIEAKKQFPGLLIKIEEISMPLGERIRIALDIFKSKFMKKKLNYPSFIGSVRQLAVMIKAGISLKDSLEDIGNNTADKLVAEIFLKSAEAIDTGKTLSDVFSEYEAYVGGIALAMIRLGEQTGDLVQALEYLADIYDDMYQNKRKMIKALRYPIVTLIAIAIAFVVLILVVVPKFKAIFKELHADLPLPTKILLGIENILENYGLVVLALIVVTVVAISFLYKTSYKFKYKADQLLLKTYLIGNIIEFASLNRFLLTLSSLIKSGIPLLDSLKISETIIGNEIIKEKISTIVKGINQGRTFREMLEETDLVNFIALRMISAGEESGELDSMLESASNYYKDRFEDLIENMQAAIEPIMLTVIGGLVLLIALGIFLPMWNLASAVKQ